MSDSDTSEDSPCLSQESIAALLEHFASKSESLDKYSNENSLLKGNDLDENWVRIPSSSRKSFFLYPIHENLYFFQQLSQFWYDDVTATTLVEEVLDQIPTDGRVALIGCPSLFYFFRKSSDLIDGIIPILPIPSTILHCDINTNDYHRALCLPNTNLFKFLPVPLTIW